MPRGDNDRWNGDPSLLKDKDITNLSIDFQNRTFKVMAWRDDGSYYEFSSRDFTNASPFGMIARGLRRMVSNLINNDASEK